MAFSPDDLRNILAGRPTPQTLAAAEATAAKAGITSAPGGAASRMPLRESSGPIDTEALLLQKLQQKNAQQAYAPQPQYVPPAQYEQPYPSQYQQPQYQQPQQQQPQYAPQYQQPHQPNYQQSPVGYQQNPHNPGPMGTFSPTTGGVPPSMLNQLLGEGHVPQQPQPYAVPYHPGPTPPAPMVDQKAQVRQLLFEEVVNNEALGPLLEQLVKTHLPAIVRQELERLKEAGRKK